MVTVWEVAGALRERCASASRIIAAISGGMSSRTAVGSPPREESIAYRPAGRSPNLNSPRSSVSANASAGTAVTA
jgi:hypothetical protein